MSTLAVLASPQPLPVLQVVRFVAEKPLTRAHRAAPLEALVENGADVAVDARVLLSPPKGMRVTRGKASEDVRLAGGERKHLRWVLTSDAAVSGDVRLTVGSANASLLVRFLPPLKERKLAYIPPPRPLHTDVLIGAHNCPLWESDKPQMWANVLKHPERTPVLGFYGQENPEVADWETKWAVEHGVSFFIYCWYRDGQGGPVKQRFGSAIHQGLFRSRFKSKLKFTIMWENQNRGHAGVAGEHDLIANLLPYWIETYFKDLSYLKVDNKPVLFIYRPEFLIDDLGGEANVARAFVEMRRACRDAGFAGLTILGEYRGHDEAHLRLMKRLGLDYTFAYCWYVGNNPTPQQAIDSQMQQIRQTQEAGTIPQVTTVSQGWSGWNDEGTIWKIPPHNYERLLRQAKDYIATIPANQLGHRMLLLDNWNEWGEGHYIAPYREYGFGYLDAVRKVFSNAPARHQDLIPEDIGRGPYDTRIRSAMAREERLQEVAREKVLKAGAPEPGLVGWWSFDEKPGAEVALDVSGNHLGGALHKAKRAPGIDGNALVCDGGCVLVGDNRLLSIAKALTIECWVKASKAGLPNNWLVNRVYGGGTATGYRLGIVDGKPCFEVPLTDWSHHLKADCDLPAGRWVHLAGTYDGKTMRIYVDGVERGTMERAGPIAPNHFHLCLGSYEIDHPAHFVGLLDEVKLYDRALSPAEVAAHYRALAGRAVSGRGAAGAVGGRRRCQ